MNFLSAKIMQWQLAVAIIFATELCFFVATSTHDPECAPPLFFKCHNTSKCISRVFVCDGDDDCGDDSDENPEQCHKELPSFAEVCKEHEFQCADRFHCIPEDDYCDGKKDCIDGSDEADDCHRDENCNGFKCASGQCIQKSWVCDNAKDCRDGSDETNCTARYNVSPANCNSTIDKYLCANRQRCIDLGLVCNNVDDCGDDSDEHPANCSKALGSCRSSPCSSICRPTPDGYQCACAVGYILKDDSCQVAELTKRKQVAIAAGKAMINYYDEPLVTSNVTIIIVACTQEQHRCHDGTCIALNLVCNGRNDCDDSSDEANCTGPICDDRSFRCTNGFCIPGNWECDGQTDCTDNSDEHESCMPPIPCALGTFSCRNGRCVHERLECNGIDDCHDNSDEEDCALETFNCTDNQYRCKDSYMCIHENLRCNGKADCPKRDDEESCGRFSDSMFKCVNGQSIPREWVCDYHFDCDDKSDEKNCSARSRPTVNCTEAQFACKTGHCISLTKACNGVDDCSDGSDEGGSCDTACLGNSCEIACHSTPNGAEVCGCRRGYKLAGDRKSCVPIGECEPGLCSQHCDNRTGSIVCSCYEGYLLRLDKVSCKATGPVMKIWTARSDDIRIVMSNKPRNPVEVLFRDPGIDIHGLDVNARDETVYWSNEDLGIISKFNVGKSNLTRASDGLGRPQLLVVDWITDNVYVYDARTPSSIKVCNIETNNCSAIITRDGPKSQVTAMAINPIAEYLFFAQTFSHFHKSSVSEIVRTNLIGSDEISIVKGNIGIVKGVAVDHQRSVIYWIDGHNNVIECVDFGGEGREVVVENLQSGVGLFLFEDSLYWKSDFGQTLYKLALYGDRRKALTKVFDEGNVQWPFVVSQVSMQPTLTNLCANNNCTHLCVIHDGRPTCLCREGTPARLRKNTACPGETIFESSNTTKSTNVCSAGNTMNLWLGSVCGLLLVAMILGMCFFCLTTKRPNQLYRPNFENVDGIRLSKWRINNSTTSTTSNSVWTTGRVFC